MRTVRPAGCARAKAPPRLTSLSSSAWSDPKSGARLSGSCALAFPVQDGDQSEQPAGGFEIDPHLAVQALLHGARPLVVDAAAAHVDGLDLVRSRGADRLIIAVANHEIVFDDAPERRQRQKMRHHRATVLAADVEHQPVA